jgi:serine protease DegS
MTNNRTINFIVGYIGKPVLVGLFVAALLLLAFPEFRQQRETADPSLMDLQQNGSSNQWSGPASYSHPQSDQICQPSALGRPLLSAPF